MKNIFWFKSGLLALGVAALTSGCVYRERVVYGQPGARVVTTETVGAPVVVEQAPPAPYVETVTVAPAPDFVWIGGAWVWRSGWVWERGHWARPIRAGAVWVPHRYEYRGGVHVFIRGGWR